MISGYPRYPLVALFCAQCYGTVCTKFTTSVPTITKLGVVAIRASSCAQAVHS